MKRHTFVSQNKGDGGLKKFLFKTEAFFTIKNYSKEQFMKDLVAGIIVAIMHLECFFGRVKHTKKIYGKKNKKIAKKY